MIPVPKKGKATCLNDNRPVTLTSVTMKVFKRLFAYKANHSVDDALSLCPHSFLHHLKTKSRYARILFIDLSSAFDTITLARLVNYRIELNVNDSLWIDLQLPV